MKKIKLLLISLIILINSSSCNVETNYTKQSIVVTSFYQYDFVKNILGEDFNNYDIILLNKNGIDMPQYTPSASDIIEISKATLFIYTGGQSEYWVNDCISIMDKKPRIILKMLDYVDMKNLEISEGMQINNTSYEQSYSNPNNFNVFNDLDELNEPDEHIWLSINNAQKMISAINEALCSINDKNKAIYQKNTDTYNNKLKKLDDQFLSEINSARSNTIIVADRFHYRYLLNDYSIKYYAAFDCYSTSIDATDETIDFFVDKINTLNLNYIIVGETSDYKLANTIINQSNNKNQKILTLNTIQNVAVDDLKNTTYIDIMEENLKILKTALN